MKTRDIIPDIILASASQARQTMLRNANVDFTAIPADIVEDVQAFDDPETAAMTLAKRKAVHVSDAHPDALVIGSDQVGWFEGTLMEKAGTPEEAIDRLKTMKGKTHTFYSGVCVAMNGEPLWQMCDNVQLTMHTGLDDAFWKRYQGCAGDVLTSCVGGYAYEAHGAWLFETVAGDYFTILGMPLKPLLHYLRTEHGVTP